jgi:Zn-dependent peptidase ImmA (M78 family)
MMTQNVFRTVLEAKESIPVNLDVLAQRLGLEIRRVPMDDRVSGYIERRPDGWMIGVNSTHPHNRQRFTIAHELGHFVHHRPLLDGGTNDTRAYRTDPETRLFNARIQRRHEIEANRFAAGLLMPGDKVREVLQELRGVNDLVSRLARIFHVSPSAMEIRLRELVDEEVASA